MQRPSIKPIRVYIYLLYTNGSISYTCIGPIIVVMHTRVPVKRIEHSKYVQTTRLAMQLLSRPLKVRSQRHN